MLLQSYPELRTRNRDVIVEALRASGYGTRIELPSGGSPDQFTVRKVDFEKIGLSFVRYDSPITIAVNPCDDILIGFQIRKVSEIAIDGEVMQNTVSDAGCLVPEQRPWTVHSPDGYEVLILRVVGESLRRKTSALLGEDRARLDLRQPSAAGGDRVVRGVTLNFARELDAVDPAFLPALVAHSTEEICVSILRSLSEQVLEAERAPAAPSDVQLGQAEQYLVANYAKPLTVENLAAVSGVSARSVFCHFRGRYDCTPHQYLEKIQLEMAYAGLLSCRDLNSVGAIALSCGFHSRRSFEHAYLKKFGERPKPMLVERPRRPRR